MKPDHVCDAFIAANCSLDHSGRTQALVAELESHRPRPPLPRSPEEWIELETWCFALELRDLLWLCESPIEQSMLLALRRMANAKICCFGDLPTLVAVAGKAEIHCQYPLEIDGAPIRLDFAIKVPGGASVAIECDGHEFHERTKEQAARDKSRDRALTAAGWKVLRFTGSEIWRDANQCANEALAIVWSEERSA